MLKQILVSQFNCFFDRFVTNNPASLLLDLNCKIYASKCFQFIALYQDPPINDCLLVLRGQRWKYMRKLLSPTFSVFKLKNASYLSKLAWPWPKVLAWPKSILLLKTQAFAVQMSTLLKKKLDVFCEILEERADSGECFDVAKYLNQLTFLAAVMVDSCQELRSADDGFVRNLRVLSGHQLPARHWRTVLGELQDVFSGIRNGTILFASSRR